MTRPSTPRLSVLASALLLAGCSTAGPPLPAGSCNSAGAKAFIGRAGSSETAAGIMRATNARLLRWAPPGAALTMDFQPQRATIHLGVDGRITAVDCG